MIAHPVQPQTEAFNRLAITRFGGMLYNANDLYIGRSLAVYGEWCQGELDLLLPLLRSGDVVVDAGANVGSHTVPFAQTVGAAGRVHAFEPQRLTFQLLCGNVALNSLANVDCWPMGIGEVPGWLEIAKLDPGQFANFGSPQPDDRSGIELVKISTLDRLQLANCRLIKADVEGMEGALLLGARQTIAHCRPLLYVENDRPASSAALIGLMHRLGYRAYWHEVPFYTPDNFLGCQQNVFGRLSALNLLGVPQEDDRAETGLPLVQGADDWPAHLH